MMPLLVVLFLQVQIAMSVVPPLLGQAYTDLYTFLR